MKFFLFPFAFVLLHFITACKGDFASIADQNSKQLSKDEIIEIARKYNLQDSIFTATPTKYGSFPDASRVYSSVNEKECEAYFAQWRKQADFASEFYKYYEERKHITSVAEYFEVLEKYPHNLQSYVETLGGMEQYQAHKKERLAGNYHLYLDAENALVWIKASEDDGKFPGKLLNR
jgi:hypothetical protein